MGNQFDWLQYQNQVWTPWSYMYFCLTKCKLSDWAPLLGYQISLVGRMCYNINIIYYWLSCHSFSSVLISQWQIESLETDLLLKTSAYSIEVLWVQSTLSMKRLYSSCNTWTVTIFFQIYFKSSIKIFGCMIISTHYIVSCNDCLVAKVTWTWIEFSVIIGVKRLYSKLHHNYR